MDMIVKSPGDKDHLLHPVLKTQSRFNQTQYLNKGGHDAMKLDLNSKHYAEQKEALDRVTPRILNQSKNHDGNLNPAEQMQNTVDNFGVKAAMSFVEWKLDMNNEKQNNKQMNST